MSLRSRWQGFRNGLRASSLMGRAFALRDRGELEAALGVCQQAIRLAGSVDPGKPDPSSFGALVVGALTIDEIARRLGQPEVAREPLETAPAVAGVRQPGVPSPER